MPMTLTLASRTGAIIGIALLGAFVIWTFRHFRRDVLISRGDLKEDAIDTIDLILEMVVPVIVIAGLVMLLLWIGSKTGGAA
jgi:hypothetical protein